MRVALLTAHAKAGDAIGNQVAEKLAFFLDRGADVSVLVESKQDLHPVVAPYCQILDANRPGGDGWESLTAADLIIVDYSQYDSLLGFLPLLVGGKARIVFDYHGVTPPELWTSHNREALQKGAQQRGAVWCADAALVHSRFAGRELWNATRFPQERSHRLGHPIDTKRFCAGRPSRDLREQLGLETSARLLLFVGRLAPNKRLPVFVEALARLKDETVHAVVIGDDTDLYQVEAQLCRERAAQLGVADRLHILGAVSDDQLVAAYRSGDVFVMPSIHEGFCIPVVEAMACGVPVVAARAGALPETVGDAGLTFIPDDPEDLARQLQRVLESRIARGRCVAGVSDPGYSPLQLTTDNGRRTMDNPRLRIAIVAFRFGTDFVGGAEQSLRTAAAVLRERGHLVEVFTTCTKSESNWSNELSEGTTEIDGIYRFRIDAHDRPRHLESVRHVLQTEGGLSPEAEAEYLRHSIHSTRLLDELRRRKDQFDAVIVGPYLYGLTWDVAREIRDKTLLMPCFHDEKFARLREWPRVYGQVGGILFHSPEEQEFAETEIGLNHPGGFFAGTVTDTETLGSVERGRQLVGNGGRYLVYCGRYSPEKNLPLLLDYAHRYAKERPERFTFVFLGEGSIPIPKEPWACDLGFVSEPVKRDVLAGAAALVQLSQNESLSLVALEAWVQGTPVVAHSRCAVLVGHLRRGGGGQAVDSYESFAEILDDLWANPAAWQARGRQGQEYVRTTFGSRTAYAERLERAMLDFRVSLAERMRRRGLDRAGTYARSIWRDRFGALVEEILDGPPRVYREEVEVAPCSLARRAHAKQQTVLIPVRVINRGTHALMSEGPGQQMLHSWIADESGGPYRSRDGEEHARRETGLPNLLMPGRSVPAVIPVRIPSRAGTYQILFGVGPGTTIQCSQPVARDLLPAGAMRLLVEEDAPRNEEAFFAPMLEQIHATLAEAERLRHLPDDYLDVTQGWFAKWKRWIKRKLLGNFKHAYVDVLSRQQSAFNRQIVMALTELTECLATLQHARQIQVGQSAEENHSQDNIGNSAADDDIIVRT